MRMAPCRVQVSGKAEKLKAEKILLDVTRFAEERAGTQLARLRKEQEALAARERIEAKLLQELVVASQRAADHSHALQVGLDWLDWLLSCIHGPSESEPVGEEMFY